MIEETMLKQCQRADSYKILAECFYVPDEKLSKTLSDFEEAYGGVFSEIIRTAPKTDDLERYKVDFSSLFVGPFKLLVPPYGSVYLENGKFMGNSTLAVKNLYEQEGLDIVLKDAPDHISVELEFMYFLALKEAEARENSNLAETTRLHDKQASFLQIHLGDWISPLADNIEKFSQTEFYKALGLATKNFVLEDLERLLGDCEFKTVES